MEYSYDNDDLIIKYKNQEKILEKNDEKLAVETMIDEIQNDNIILLIGFIELISVVLGITLVLYMLIFNSLDKLFINIHNGETPFTMENVNYIKKMAIFMIIATILPNISGVIGEMIIGENLGLGFEMLDLIYILFLFSMSYIFEYGYQIQLDSKGKMYGDENE